ncbi:hypothetical protein H6P81_011812 [Aristolochia fimbriata]|uniref:Serine/threonine-protein kinase 19 n=1 Tax=Aristolochia fimbriata TaxID=158543 RepID=A0AAV7EAF2_ARIFI|nr:hypothetical protein H6P81_011812 [Aristolochia fimbriata]
MSGGEGISGSVGKKRRREEEIGTSKGEYEEEGLPLLEKELTFTDTLIALRIMRSQFPQKVAVEPFVLRSQLYSSVKDRTQVDRELESLRRQRTLRIFKLNIGQDDDAIMFMEDYIKQVEIVVKRMEAKNPDDAVVFDWFITHVIGSKLDASIEHRELCSLLSCGGKVKDKHISFLINTGLLTRQLIDSNMYWFAIPNIGFVLKGLAQGRKELLSFLNRRKYKEIHQGLERDRYLQPTLLQWLRRLQISIFIIIIILGCGRKWHV